MIGNKQNISARLMTCLYKSRCFLLLSRSETPQWLQQVGEITYGLNAQSTRAVF